jgi:hypothetical protein
MKRIFFICAVVAVSVACNNQVGGADNPVDSMNKSGPADTASSAAPLDTTATNYRDTTVH